MPYTGEKKFPAKVEPDFLAALRGQTSMERTAYATDGSVSFAMDETSLQLLAAKNPIACALVFDHVIDNVRRNLIGLSSERLTDVAIGWSENNPEKMRKQGSPSSPHLNPNSKPNTKPDRRYLWRSDM